MGLLDIAVLMGNAGIVGGGLQPIMGQQRKIAVGELRPPASFEDVDGRTQVVGAMDLRHATDLPETGLQALGKRLEAL